MAQRTIVAHFDSRSEAEAAQAALAGEGVAASAVRMLPDEGSTSTYARSGSETAYDHRQDEGGFWASLGNLGLPEEDRYTYAEGMSRGGVTLSVTTDDAHYDRVAQVLEDNGAVDLDAREAEWRSAGWTGYASAGATAPTGQGTAQSMAQGDQDVIQVMEEQIQVGKRQVEGGRVRVRSYTVERPVEAQVELRSERVTIERRPVDRVATAADLASVGDQTLEAHERTEQAVVSKEARVVEEIGLRTEAEQHTETVRDTVRKTEVEVVDERGDATRLTGADDATRRR